MMKNEQGIKNLNLSKLKRIFYSAQRELDYDYFLLEKVEKAIKEDLINITKKNISTIDQFHKIIDDFNNGRLKQARYDGGKKRHWSLKVIAEKFLKNEFNKNAKIEKNFNGRVVDVITPDSKYFNRMRQH